MKSVLIIEDDRAVRENTAELLSLNGYSVLTAENGKDGFNRVKANMPDIILCDILMPETDGKAFLKLVKSDTATSTIPLIFFSAGSVPNEVKKGIIQGADEYLPKPFTEEELMQAIARNLNRQNK